MSNIISGGRSVDLNVQAGQSLKVTTISGTYTATVLAGAGAGTALATDSADGATYGPYAAAVTIRIKSSATGFVDYDVGVSPSLGYRSPAYFGHNTAGDIASLVDGDGNTLYATTAVGTSRSLTDADNGRTLECTATVTLTVPIGLMTGFGCAIIPSGTTSIASSGGALLNGATTTLTRAAATNAIFAIVPRASASNSYVVTGT